MAQRYQKEIEEILDQANAQVLEGKATRGRGAPQRPVRRSPPPQPPASRSSSWFPVRISAARIVVLGVALLVAALVLSLFHVLPGLVGPLGWGGVVLFIIAYIRYFSGPRRTVERRWRQRSIDDDTPGESFWKRFWR